MLFENAINETLDDILKAWGEVKDVSLDKHSKTSCLFGVGLVGEQDQ